MAQIGTLSTNLPLEGLNMDLPFLPEEGEDEKATGLAGLFHALLEIDEDIKLNSEGTGIPTFTLESVDPQVLETLTPKAQEFAQREGLKPALGEAMVQLQDKFSEQPQGIVKLEKLAQESPEVLQEILMKEPIEKKEKLAALIFDEPLPQDITTAPERERAEFMAKAAEVDGKIFRNQMADIAKDMHMTRGTKDVIIAMQANENSQGQVAAGGETNQEGDLEGQQFSQHNETEAKAQTTHNNEFKIAEVRSPEVESHIQVKEAQAVTQTSPNTEPKPAPAVSRQVVEQLQEVFANQRFHAPATEQVTVQLQPANLGAVEFLLKFKNDGTLSAVVTAETQALTALQKDIQALSDGFSGSGFSATTEDFQFEEKQKGQRWSARPRESQIETAPTVATAPTLRSHSGNVNLVA